MFKGWTKEQTDKYFEQSRQDMMKEMTTPSQKMKDFIDKLPKEGVVSKAIEEQIFARESVLPNLPKASLKMREHIENRNLKKAGEDFEEAAKKTASSVEEFKKALESIANSIPEKYTALPFPTYPNSALSEKVDTEIARILAKNSHQNTQKPS